MTDWYRVAAVAVNESVGVLKIINSLSANKLKRQAINDNVCGAHELSWDPLRQTWRYVCMWVSPLPQKFENFTNQIPADVSTKQHQIPC
jgi:hypothetical protein